MRKGDHRLRVACVGIGGFARHYVDAAWGMREGGEADLAGVVEKFPDRFPEQAARLREGGVPVFADLDALFRGVSDIDLVTIGTGLHLHFPMAMAALERSCHVFLAKPSCVLVQHVDELAKAARARQRIVAVDFQHAYSKGMQHIKECVSSGQLGDIRRIVARLAWCRSERYYRRNAWAGRVRLNDVYVLDGPMNNPHAHYIQNALYLAERRRNAFAEPVSVQAELYRAHDIEGEDTACIRAVTVDGVEVLVFSTLAGEGGISRTDLDVYGTRGTASWNKETHRIAIDGKEALEADTGGIRSAEVIRRCVQCIREGTKPLVTVEDTRGHVLLTNGAYESSGRIVPVAEAFIDRSRRDNDEWSSIRGINTLIEEAGARGRLFSDMHVPWARPAKPVDLKGYTGFQVC